MDTRLTEPHVDNVNPAPAMAKIPRSAALPIRRRFVIIEVPITPEEGLYAVPDSEIHRPHDHTNVLDLCEEFETNQRALPEAFTCPSGATLSGIETGSESSNPACGFVAT